MNSRLATAFLFIAGMLRLPVKNVRLSMQLAIESSVVLFLGSFVWRKNKSITAFLFVCLALTFYNVNDYSYAAMKAVTVGVLIYWIAIEYCSEESILNAICLMAIANASWQVIQLFGMDPFFKTIGTPQFVGLLPNANFTAAFTVFTMPAFMREKWKYFLVFPIAGLVMAKCIGGVITLAAAVIYLSFVYGWWRYTVPVCLAGVGAFLFVDLPGMERGKSWGEMFMYAMDSPIIGHGLGSFLKISEKVPFGNIGAPWHQCHNEYLQVLFELGLVGLLPVLAYVGTVLKDIRKVSVPVACGMLCVLANSFINHAFHIGTTALVGILWMAVFDIERRERRAKMKWWMPRWGYDIR